MNETITGTEDVAVSPHQDPFQRRMSGTAIHGHTKFDVPFMSHIAGNLYQGGCEQGLILPDKIDHVISLYRWESYSGTHPLKTYAQVELYDDSDIPEGQLFALADLANECLKDGPTLIHCQAGLNRSSLLAAIVMVKHGIDGAKYTPREAIDRIREMRSPACLCNPHFEKWLLGEENPSSRMGSI